VILQLTKRKERRDEAQKQLNKATETGDTETIEKMSKRLVRATKEHSDDCKHLLSLMGIPYVDVSLFQHLFFSPILAYPRFFQHLLLGYYLVMKLSNPNIVYQR